MDTMTRTERLLRLARLRGDRAAELILTGKPVILRQPPIVLVTWDEWHRWTEAELREAWGR